MAARSVLLSCALVLIASPALAQTPLVDGLGGPHGFGTACEGRNDDGSSAIIDITPSFPSGLHFFSGVYTTMSVNENGNITFNGNLPTYTPNPFPVASQPMIAPFWADVDTRRPDSGGPFGLGCNAADPGDGEARIGDPCDSGNDTNGSVWWYLEPNRIVITWDHVGYYMCHDDLRDSFQLILTAADSTCGGMSGAGGNFDVEFRYNECSWETGDASGGMMGFGGTPGQAGFDAGDSVNYVEIPGSRTAGVISMLCTNSNIGTPGVWHFGVRGGVINCPDAGMDCTIAGAMGVCAVGRTQCVMSGTTCEPVNTASPEVCDALDNNCDGMTDEGDICPAGSICDRGVCVPPCFEHSCADGQMCNTDGRCVDTACATVTCGPGQRCVAGMCVGVCSGITCPLGQQCRLGRCVDSCSGVTCDTGYVCEAGLCQPTCPCRMCHAGQECDDAAGGLCVDTGCAGRVCDPGTFCMGGTCMDACTGAVCPAGQPCVGGVCQDPSVPDAGVGRDAGFIHLPDGAVIPGDAGSCPDGSRAATCHGAKRGGCCSVAGTRDTPLERAGGLAALAAALALVLARRRRKL